MGAKLDSFDLKILAELQQNGGLSNQELADRVGLSPSPCSRRIRELEHSGVIRERVVRLDPRAVGLDLTVLIHIRMDRHTPERFAQFESAVRGYPEVLECYLITGQEADYQLKISVPTLIKWRKEENQKVEEGNLINDVLPLTPAPPPARERPATELEMLRQEVERLKQERDRLRLGIAILAGIKVSR